MKFDTMIQKIQYVSAGMVFCKLRVSDLYFLPNVFDFAPQHFVIKQNSF